MGSRPVIRLFPSSVEFSSLAAGNDRPLQQIENLIGPPDGRRVICDFTGYPANATSNNYRVRYTVPAEAEGGLFDVVRWVGHGMLQNPPAEGLGWNIKLMTQAGAPRGQSDGVHEFADTPVSRDSSAFRTRICSRGASALHVSTQASSVSNSRGSIVGFETFGGVELAAQMYGNPTSGQRVEIDSLELEIAYVPRDPAVVAGGVALAMPTISVAEVTAASAGLAVPAGYTEVAWANPANARTLNATRASVVTPPNLDGNDAPTATSGYVTRFLEYRWTAGSLANRTLAPRELRAFIRGQFSTFATTAANRIVGTFAIGEPLPEAFVEEIALVSPSRGVVAKLSEISAVGVDRDAYGTLEWPMAQAGGVFPTAASSASAPDMQWVAAMDVRDLDDSTIADLDADDGTGNNRARGSILIRYRAPVRVYKSVARNPYPYNLDPAFNQVIDPPLPEEYDVCAMAVNDVTFTWSFEPAVPATVGAGELGADNQGSGNMSSRTRSGERVLAAVSVSQPSVPASRVVKLDGREIATAIEGLSPGWRFVKIDETGTSRPTCGRIGLIAASDAAGGTVAGMEVFGVRPGETGVVVLESLGSASFVFPTPIGAPDSVTGVTAESVSVTAPTVSKLSGTFLQAQSERPAGVDVRALGERYIGLALRCGNGSAGSGKSVHPTWQPIWE